MFSITFISPNGIDLVATALTSEQAISYSEKYLQEIIGGRLQSPVGHTRDRESDTIVVGFLIDDNYIDPDFRIEIKKETLH